MSEDKSASKAGAFLLFVWLILGALKLDGIIDWMWTVIVVGPIVAWYGLTLTMTFLAFAAARRLMRKLDNV